MNSSREMIHVRLPRSLVDCLRDRALTEGITLNAAVNRAVIDSLGMTCPTCNGAGVVALDDNEEDPAPVSEAGVTTAEETHSNAVLEP